MSEELNTIIENDKEAEDIIRKFLPLNVNVPNEKLII